MQKLFFLLAGSAVIALMVPQAFERYRSELLVEEALDPAPAVIEVAAPAASAAGRVARLDADGAGHYRTTARLNGRTEEVLVDTGATYVAVSEATARRLGVRLTPADYRHTASTANGTIPIALAKLDRVEIGPIAVRDVEVMVSKGEVLGTTLLGMSFLGKLKSFEVENGRLELVE